MKKRFDHLYAGLIPGLVLPLAVLLLFWIVRSEDGLTTFLREMDRAGILTKLISLAALPNLLLFFVYTWTQRNRSARGVLLSTFVLALGMMLLKAF